MRASGRKQEGKAPQGTKLQQIWIDGSAGPKSLRVCVFRTDEGGESAELPIVLYLHGGGYAMGNPESAGEVIARMVKARPCVVVAPDYRKSLDAPYPAAIDDCYATLEWADVNRKQIGANAAPIAVIGHSAGGGLTLATCLRARDRSGPKIAFQMPIYPMIDDRMTLPSATDNRAPVWNSKSNALAWSLYLGELGVGDQTVPYDAAPARAKNLSGMPPTATFVGSLDPFLDETSRMADQLRRNGVPSAFEVFEGAFHASELLVPKAKISRKANAYFLKAFEDGMDGDFKQWS